MVSNGKSEKIIKELEKDFKNFQANFTSTLNSLKKKAQKMSCLAISLESILNDFIQNKKS